MVQTILSDLFSSKARAAIFESLFHQSGPEIYLRELERKTNLSVSTLKNEFERLIKHDLLISRQDGNRIYYKANKTHPLYSVFTSLIEKTYGIHRKLTQIIENRDDIEIAFIFGSFAKQKEVASSDIDLFIIGTISSMDISDFTYEISQKVDREINYYNFTKESFMEKVKERVNFILSFKETEKIFLKGSIEELQRLYRQSSS